MDANHAAKWPASSTPETVTSTQSVPETDSNWSRSRAANGATSAVMNTTRQTAFTRLGASLRSTRIALVETATTATASPAIGDTRGSVALTPPLRASRGIAIRVPVDDRLLAVRDAFRARLEARERRQQEAQ